jgi:hypothetical protein
MMSISGGMAWIDSQIFKMSLNVGFICSQNSNVPRPLFEL